MGGVISREVRTDDGVVLRVRDHRPDRVVEGARRFLLVHGLASNALLWDGVGAALAAAGHRSVAVDLRSHGASDASDDLAPHRIVTDLLEVIAATELSDPVVVGQSWGGNVVVELAATHPTSVAGVVGVDGGAIWLADRFPDLDACWEALAPPSFGTLRWDALARAIEGRVAGWPDGARDAQLGNLIATADGGVRARLSRARHRSIIEHLYAQRPLDLLGALEVPMLLLRVTGGPQEVLPTDWIDAARRTTPRLTVVDLPGRDHDVHLQHPRLVARLVIDWLAGQPLPDAA